MKLVSNYLIVLTRVTATRSREPPCVEIMRNSQTRNVTLNVLCGVSGIRYANTINGASNTIELKFLSRSESEYTTKWEADS